MNYKMVGFVLGRIFLIEAALMLFPMGCAAIYGEWASIPAFLIPVLIYFVATQMKRKIRPEFENGKEETGTEAETEADPEDDNGEQ